MIRNLVKAKEISVITKNEVGALAHMMSFLVNHGINVETIVGYSNQSGRQGNLTFITDNNQGAIAELVNNGYEYIEERDVIVVELENQPGTLKNVSVALANSGININYFYCTTCSSGCPAKIVLATT
ncbi:MAG: hypothetical protein KKD11_07265, partial [Candidatus Omnitrophica bacterium]|nr:hypothetical protein [Candidatus Omnitrophota bacterium]